MGLSVGGLLLIVMALKGCWLAVITASTTAIDRLRLGLLLIEMVLLRKTKVMASTSKVHVFLAEHSWRRDLALSNVINVFFSSLFKVATTYREVALAARWRTHLNRGSVICGAGVSFFILWLLLVLGTSKP
jgi:hypothetical protein